jgi:hypothetical protein
MPSAYVHSVFARPCTMRVTDHTPKLLTEARTARIHLSLLELQYLPSEFQTKAIGSQQVSYCRSLHVVQKTIAMYPRLGYAQQRRYP